MPESKKQEKDVMQVYYAYWDSYLNGEMDIFQSYLDDDFQVIGTTEGEVFRNKKETLQFYKTTADQIAGKVELRNRNIQQNPGNGIVSFTEFSDAYILVDGEWVFYAKFRITSMLRKSDDGWKFFRQHGSIPDSRAEEGEQLASEKIRLENLELRDAVKRRTVELESKNRDLEIEAALERVRAIALSMKKPTDMLEVCRVISNQLTQFNVTDIRNVQTVIINESKGTYLNYQYFTSYDRLVTEETDPEKHPTVLEMVHAMQKSADSFFSGSIEGHKLDDFRKYREKENQFPDPILEETDAIYYHFYSIGQGGLGITTYKPLTTKGLDIFKRFHNVFTLAYRRFLDIEKAEAQAREAQIEASLERVRSLALGMHHSEEVGRVSDGFFSEFNKLTVKILGCSIVVIDEEKDSMELWRARSDVALKPFDKHSFSATMTTVKNNLPDFFPVFYNALLEKKDNLMYELSGDERLSFFNTVVEQGKYSEEDKAKLLKSIPDNVVTHYIFFKLGYLVLISKNILPDDNLAIARRFVDVFDFAYTRFLDIQRAEVQAREAQIETALERVRTLAMSMHKSNDLTKAVATVFSELSNLGLNTIRCGIGIMQGKNKMVDVWTTSSAKTGSLHISGNEKLEGHPLLDKIYSGWENQKDFEYLLRDKDLKKYYEVTSQSNLKVPAPEIKDVSNIKVKQYYYCVMFPAGGLFAFRDEEFSEEAKLLMRRFSDVFHLAFTRHLDLKQAEEQNKIIQAENERKTKELEEARAMQLSMLPKVIPQFQNLDIAVYMQTATEVGGDYYDFSTKEDGTLNIVLGDATGHGMKAGIMVSAMKSIFTTNAPKMDITDFFNNANSGIKSMNLKRMMMGFTMLNINKNDFKLINAGMPPIFLYRKKYHAVDEITGHGMPIGAMNQSIYTVINLSLETGDVLLLLSDGMPELHNDKNEMYGYEQIKDGFKKVADKEPEEIIHYLKNEGESWVNEKVPDDDVTFVVIKLKS